MRKPGARSKRKHNVQAAQSGADKPVVDKPAELPDSATPIILGDDGNYAWNRAEIARMWGVAPQTVDRWLAEIENELSPNDLRNPVLASSGRGRAKAIDARKLKAWLDSEAAAREAQLAAKEQNRRELIQEFDLQGGEVNGLDALSRADYRAHLEDSALAIRVGRERRSLVPKADVREELAKVIRFLRGRLEAVPDRLEQRLALDADQVDAIEAELTRIQDGLAKILMTADDLDELDAESELDLSA